MSKFIDEVLALPDGVHYDDAVRLKNYATRLVEHAADALAHQCSISYEGSTLPEDRSAYINSLQACRSYNISAVEKLGIELVPNILGAFSPSDHEKVIKLLGDYYNHQDPLPSSFYPNESLMGDILLWEAASDILAFAEAFVEKAVKEDDPRDIRVCLNDSLSRNGLVNAFNAATIHVQPGNALESPNFIIAFLPVRRPFDLGEGNLIPNQP